MKTYLALLLVLGMLFLVAVVAMAEDSSGSVYFDLGVSGSSSNKINMPNLPGALIGTNPDLLGASTAKMDFDGTVGYLIGGEYDFNRFKVVAEYSSYSFENTGTDGTVQPALTGGASVVPFTKSSDSSLDYSSIVTLVKGGYRFLDNDNFKLDITVGYLSLSTSGMSGSYKDTNFTNGGPALGLDVNYDFSKKFALNLTYGTTLDASSSMEALDDLSPSSKSSSLTAWRVKGIYMINDKWGISLAYSNLASALKYKYTGLGNVKIDSTFSGFALGANYKF